jgi:hypothetical protein
VGISFVTTLLARLSQKHLAMLAAHAASGNIPFETVRSGLAAATSSARAEPGPTDCKRPGRKSTSWPRCRPACWPMWMSSGSWCC